jgi:hypothetical protein
MMTGLGSPDPTTPGRRSRWLRSSSSLMVVVMAAGVACVALVRLIFTADAPLIVLGAAVGIVAVLAVTLTIVRWIEGDAYPPADPLVVSGGPPERGDATSHHDVNGPGRR